MTTEGRGGTSKTFLANTDEQRMARFRHLVEEHILALLLRTLKQVFSYTIVPFISGDSGQDPPETMDSTKPYKY